MAEPIRYTSGEGTRVLTVGGVPVGGSLRAPVNSGTSQRAAAIQRRRAHDLDALLAPFRAPAPSVDLAPYLVAGRVVVAAAPRR